jgi:hypothetical protein
MARDFLNLPFATKAEIDAAMRDEATPSSGGPSAVEWAEFLSDPVASRPLWEKAFANLRGDPNKLTFDD